MDTRKGDAGATAGKPRRGMKIVGIAACALAGILVLVVAVLTVITLWLTPTRLTELVNARASEYFNADVKASNIRFTVWSSFPHFFLETDSIVVVSRNLHVLPDSARARLPENSDRLASVAGIEGSINILRLLWGQIVLRNVTVRNLDLNMVAYNDSINNYSILPPTDKSDFKVPYFSADTVRIINPEPVHYYSAATRTSVVANIRGAEIARAHGHGQEYTLRSAGTIDAHVGTLEVLRGFPFELDGGIGLKFRPFRVSMSQYGVCLGNVSGRIQMDMEVGKDVSLNNFIYRIDDFNPQALLEYFPSMQIPYLSRLKADLPVTASARLCTPYRFTSTALPSLRVNFSVKGGSVAYTLSRNETCDFDDVAIGGSFFFNGNAPDSSYLDIPALRVRGDGISLDASARVTDLMGSPTVETRLKGTSELKRLAYVLPSLQGWNIRGKADCDTKIVFRVDNQEETQGISRLRDVWLSGDVSVCDFSFMDPSGEMNACGGKLNLHLLNEVSDGKAGVDSHDNLTADITLDRGTVKVGGGNFDFHGLSAHVNEDKLNDRVFGNLSRNPLDVRLNVGSFSFSSLSDSLRFDAGQIGMEGTVVASGAGIPEVNGTALIGSAALNTAAVGLSVSGAKVKMNASQRADMTASHGGTPAFPDSAILEKIPHSPEFLTVRAPASVKKFLKNVDVKVDASISRGRIETDAFPVDNTFSLGRIYTDMDSVYIKGFRFRSQKTAAQFSGSIRGLRDLLNGIAGAPLRADINMEIDTVNINQLAHAYQRGLVMTKGSAASLAAPKPEALTASDTTAFLFPRNLTAIVRASAKETVYTNLHLYDLSTEVFLSNGDLMVDHLNISADFGHADMGLTYRTSDVRDMGLRLNAGIMDVDVVRFFERFHTLLLMMPQMKNLSGFVSIKADGSVDIYPDMYADIPSLKAELKLSGRDLVVHQNAFIRRLTRMMLIHTSKDIHIPNMNVRASVHDNLLELYPFYFEFDRYKLRMEGVNNFNGNLYYHVGVLKSPLPFPFGINIQGLFHHPQLRFGGAEYKVSKGAEVTASVMEENEMNIPREVKYYMKEFLRKAAESDTISQ